VRFPNEKTVSFYHLTTTGGQSQPYSGTADVTAGCGVIPMDRKDSALEGVDLTDPWELYCPVSADIRLNDKVTITGDSANYYVKHIFSADLKSRLSHKRVTVAKKA
jgi:hypothetical protein